MAGRRYSVSRYPLGGYPQSSKGKPGRLTYSRWEDEKYAGPISI